MKKILLLIAAVAMVCAAVSCSEDDEVKRGDGVFTVNTTMVNHIVDLNQDSAIGIATTRNKLILDTVQHKASLELHYTDTTAHVIILNDITATPKRLGFYELTTGATDQLQSFKGYVDFNEGSMRYTYVTTGGIRVISTIPEVFFLKTENTIQYDDTTPTTKMENVMYQFNIEPAGMMATVRVMGLVHAKDVKYFNSITANSVPFTVTPNGYVFDNDTNVIKTTAIYRAFVDSTGSTFSTTDKYPFNIFKANVDLVNDRMSVAILIDSSAYVTATGRTYPDYTGF